MAGGSPKDKPPTGLPGRASRGPILAIVVGRFMSNVAFRLVFPFLPRIASGLGVSLGTLGTAIAMRDLAGVASPALGRGADRVGHVRSMTIALVGLAAGLMLAGIAGGLTLFTVALVVIVVAKHLFDVGSGAWIGETVPFQRRGRAIGMVETTWALAFVLAMPIAALTIRAGTWRTPFLASSALCLVMAAALPGFVTEPEPEPLHRSEAGHRPRIGFAVSSMALLGVGHQMLLVTFAAFLEVEHAVSVSGLGLAAAVVGMAELGGSGAAAALIDTLGKARSTRLALALGIPASLLVPLGRHGLVVALLILGVWFALSEFAIVSMLSLFTELDVRARGAVIGTAFGGWAIGNSLGALVGSRLFDEQGMTVTSGVVALAFSGAWLVHRIGVSEPAVHAEVSS